MKKRIIYFNLILLILMQLDVLAQNNMQKDNAALKRYKNDVSDEATSAGTFFLKW